VIPCPLLFLLGLGHRRSLGDRLVALDHEVAQHGVVEAEGADELVERVLRTLDVHHQVMRLVNLVDRMGELTPAPVFFAVHGTAGAFDHAPITLQHRGNLLALVRMDQKHDFVVSQFGLLSD